MNLDPQRLAGNLRFPIFRVDVIGIPNHRDSCKIRRHLVQKLQAFGGEIGGNKRNPSDIAAGTGEARHQTGLNRILAHRHHDRYRAGCGSYQRCYVATEREYDVGFDRNQLCRKGAQPLWLTLRITILDNEVLCFDVSQVPQTSAKCADVRFGLGCSKQQCADARNCLSRALGEHEARPRDRSAAERG